MLEKAMTLVFLLFSAAYTCMARGLAFGTVPAPKAGFLPTIAGGVAILFSLLLLVKQLSGGQAEGQERVEWRRLGFVILGLGFYVTFLSIVGYAAATFVTMLYLLKVSGISGWTGSIAVAASVAAGFYLVFGQLFGIILP